MSDRRILLALLSLVLVAAPASAQGRVREQRACRRPHRSRSGVSAAVAVVTTRENGGRRWAVAIRATVVSSGPHGPVAARLADVARRAVAAHAAGLARSPCRPYAPTRLTSARIAGLASRIAVITPVASAR